MSGLFSAISPTSANALDVFQSAFRQHTEQCNQLVRSWLCNPDAKSAGPAVPADGGVARGSERGTSTKRA